MSLTSRTPIISQVKSLYYYISGDNEGSLKIREEFNTLWGRYMRQFKNFVIYMWNDYTCDECMCKKCVRIGGEYIRTYYNYNCNTITLYNVCSNCNGKGYLKKSEDCESCKKRFTEYMNSS